MAQLILTPEEQASPAYLDWSDEDLGKVVRGLALTLAEKNGKQSLFVTAASLLLIKYVADCGEIKTIIGHEGVTIPTPIGDWKVTVEKIEG